MMKCLPRTSFFALRCDQRGARQKLCYSAAKPSSRNTGISTSPKLAQRAPTSPNLRQPPPTILLLRISMFGALGGVQWTNLDFLGGKTPEAGFKGCLSAAWISRSSNLSPSLSDMFSQTGICICTYGWYGLAVFHQENLLLDPSVLIPG